jgi:DNA-binding phage protein
VEGIKALKTKTLLELRNTGKIMKYAKVPTSDSYHESKISNLKDPNYSAAYLSLIFDEEEEGDLEMGIMRQVLRDVFEALGEPIMSAEDAKLHLEKLDVLLPQAGIATIYALANWLKVLGLKLTVAVAQEDEGEESSSVSDVELVEVAKV